MSKKINIDQSSLRLLYYRYRDSSLYTWSFLVAMAAVSILLFSLFILPQFHQWFSVQQEVTATRGIIDVLHQNITYLTSLDQSQVDNDYKVAVNAIPIESDISGIITALTVAAAQANVQLDQFSFNPSSGSSNAVSQTIHPIAVTISVKSTIINVKKFTAALATELPLVRIKGIQSQENTSSITLEFYSKPLPKVTVDRTQSVKAAQNTALLHQLQGWNASTQAFNNVPMTGSSSAVSDPF